jgi:hypothetical protein
MIGEDTYLINRISALQLNILEKVIALLLEMFFPINSRAWLFHVEADAA